jgi:hypothetical protein
MRQLLLAMRRIANCCVPLSGRVDLLDLYLKKRQNSFELSRTDSAS